MNASVTILVVTLGLLVPQPAPAQQGKPLSLVQTLRGADATTIDPAPPERPYAGKLPGNQKPLARTFTTQPPLIPHAIEGFDEVTLKNNPCLACHGPDNYKNLKAPKLADSHFKDRDGKVLPAVSGARYQCMACHVPQAAASPLVANVFRGDLAAKKK